MYRLRPSAYAVIQEPRGIAAIRTALGLFLPGGGQHAGEGPEQAVMREVAEECGLQITLEERLGAADQYVYSAQEATHFLKRSVFFRARIVGVITSWVGAAEAFVHESHQWAATRER